MTPLLDTTELPRRHQGAPAFNLRIQAGGQPPRTSTHHKDYASLLHAVTRARASARRRAGAAASKQEEPGRLPEAV